MNESPSVRDRRILDVVRALGEGEVVSYGDIAEAAGYPRQSRLVGRLLAQSVDDLPWWRVVASNGRMVPGLEVEQAQLLAAEGVSTSGGRVRRSPHGRFRCSQP